MKMKFLINNILLFLCVANVSSTMALSDIAGGVDHPKVPRVKGSVLIAQDKSDYAEGAFFVPKKENSNKVIERFEEGKSTRLVYLLAKGHQPIFALRNYQEAFKKLGDVTDIYSCKSGECDGYLGQNYVWSKRKGRRLSTEFPALNRLYDATGFYANQVYWFATIKSDKSTYAVSVYSAVRSEMEVKGLKDMDTGQGLVPCTDY